MVLGEDRARDVELRRRCRVDIDHTALDARRLVVGKVRVRHRAAAHHERAARRRLVALERASLDRRRDTREAHDTQATARDLGRILLAHRIEQFDRSHLWSTKKSFWWLAAATAASACAIITGDGVLMLCIDGAAVGRRGVERKRTRRAAELNRLAEMQRGATAARSRVRYEARVGGVDARSRSVHRSSGTAAIARKARIQ